MKSASGDVPTHGVCAARVTPLFSGAERELTRPAYISGGSFIYNVAHPVRIAINLDTTLAAPPRRAPAAQRAYIALGEKETTSTDAASRLKQRARDMSDFEQL